MTKIAKVLNRVVQNPDHSNVLKVVTPFLLVIFGIIFTEFDAKQLNVKRNENGSEHKFGRENSLGLDAFGYQDFYTWYIVNSLIACVLPTLIHWARAKSVWQERMVFIWLKANSMSCTTMIGWFYVGNGIFRLLIRHFLTKHDLCVYLFCVSQIMTMIIAPMVRTFDGFESTKELNEHIAQSDLIFFATTSSSNSFNFAFLFLTQSKATLWADVLHVCVLVINCKKILKLDDLVKYCAGDNQGKVEKNGVQKGRPQNKDHSKFWSIFFNSIIGMYLHLVLTFYSPIDYWKLTFIDLAPSEKCQSTALFALVFGISTISGTMLIGILRMFDKISRFCFTVFALLGHILTFTFGFIYYEMVMFKEIALNDENIGFQFVCTFCIAFFTAMLYYQSSYYSNFKVQPTKQTGTAISIFNRLLIIPMYYLKMERSKVEQFGVLIVAALMMFIALCYYESIAHKHFVDLKSQQSSIDSTNKELSVELTVQESSLKLIVFESNIQGSSIGPDIQGSSPKTIPHGNKIYPKNNQEVDMMEGRRADNRCWMMRVTNV